MKGAANGLEAHAKTGLTHICRAWAVTRRDGVVMGFTDHDCGMNFDGIAFHADSGLTAKALTQSTGLSVDNSEALGALSHSAISEADIAAGRYDGAEVRFWLVNWSAPEERLLQFHGTIGEIRRVGGAFHAELRGLADAMNQPRGLVYQRPCSAVLGNERCGKDLSLPGYSAEIAAITVNGARVFEFTGIAGYEPGWFEGGTLEVLGGSAIGARGVIKSDRIGSGTTRRIELWTPLDVGPTAGDLIRITAGCDKRLDTCRLKFDNVLNFRGFPDIPGEDWLVASPAQGGRHDGGSRR